MQISIRIHIETNSSIVGRGLKLNVRRARPTAAPYVEPVEHEPIGIIGPGTAIPPQEQEIDASIPEDEIRVGMAMKAAADKFPNGQLTYAFQKA